MPVNLYIERVVLNPAFYVVFDRIAPAANKYMATLFNTSTTELLMVDRILRFNWQQTAVSEAALDQYIARITARTAGTAVTIRSADTLDTVPVGGAADTNSTVVTEAHIARRFFYAQNEIQSAGSVPQLSDWHGYMLAGENGAVIWSRQSDMKGFILRQNQGISIRNITSSTAGSCSYVIEFTSVYA